MTRMGPRIVAPVLAALLAALMAALVAGCGTGLSEEQMADKRAELAQRPSIEEISARYEQMLDWVRERLSVELGPFQWVNRETGRGSGCSGDFTNLGGVSRFLDRWTYEGNIPDAQWDRAVQIVAEVTREYGFGQPKHVVDQPGNHQVGGFDNYGGSYTFRTRGYTILAAETNCHFPAATLASIRNSPPPPD